MPFNRLFRAAPVALFLCLALLPVAPARASTSMGGGMSLEGTVDFESGSWQGVSSGSLSGRHTAPDGEEVEWSLLLIAPATALFEYVDPVGLGPCVAGVAGGKLRVTGTAAREQAEVFGAYYWGGPLPRSIVGFRFSSDFEWRWAGNAGALVLSNVVVEVEVYAHGWITVSDGAETLSVGAAPTTLDCADGSLDATVSGLALS